MKCVRGDSPRLAKSRKNGDVEREEETEKERREKTSLRTLLAIECGGASRLARSIVNQEIRHPRPRRIYIVLKRCRRRRSIGCHVVVVVCARARRCVRTFIRARMSHKHAELFSRICIDNKVARYLLDQPITCPKHSRCFIRLFMRFAAVAFIAEF